MAGRVNTGQRRSYNVALANSVLSTAGSQRSQRRAKALARAEGNTCPICLEATLEMGRVGSETTGWTNRSACGRCRYALALLRFDRAAATRGAKILKEMEA